MICTSSVFRPLTACPRLLPLCLASILACIGSVAAAELLPRPEAIVLPEEKPALDEMNAALLERKPPSLEAALRQFDSLLVRTARPTKLRGLVQYFRAGLLEEMKRNSAAREAIDESIRLLPDYSGPLLLGSAIYAYDDLPGEAADLLIRASRLDPAIVAKIQEYEINNILSRLDGQRDRRRAGLLSARSLEIGWLGGSLDARSRLAFRAIDARMEAGDLSGAKSLVPKLLSPGHSRSLLVDRKYEPLWADIERWAGPQLQEQWLVYLRESRAKWQASKDHESALAYARALRSAGHHRTLIREMSPLFDRQIDRARDYDLVFMAALLADALAREGRWADITSLFNKAAAVWPLGSDANALNIAANRARFLLYEGKAAEGLAAMDAALADARDRGGEVNSDALAAMQQVRACLLHELGRAEGAVISQAFASAARPVELAALLLCLNKPEAARDVLLAAAADENAREEVIQYMQDSDAVPMQSDYGRRIHERHAALRADPQLRAAVGRHGRFLPFSIRAGAPPESD